MTSFHIPHDDAQFMWNRDTAPVLIVDPRSTIVVEVANASGGQLQRTSTTAEVQSLDFAHVNPVTGPIAVRGAEPGDALVVEILSVDLDDWGWTANIPGFGLLSEDFPDAHLRISRVTRAYAELLPGLRIPTVPFIGTIGVAPAEPGDHSLIPPRLTGGNMDIRHVTPGSRLWLPVAVPGALLSIGDTHAAQGDGEVAGTAIETSSTVTIRVHITHNAGLRSPRIETHPMSARKGAAWATTGIGPDLWDAARNATRDMIALITQRTGLSALDAYLLVSVAGDLKISEIVDAPHWVVSMHLEKDILGGALE